MNKTLELIKADIITMNGGKNGMRTMFVILFVIWGVAGFAFSPIYGLIVPLLMGVFFVPMIFQNELKYHSEKLHSILPINRRDLVTARFLFVTVLFTAMFIAFYLLMLLSLKIKLNYIIFGDDAEMFDTMGLLVSLSQGMFTEVGLLNLMYFTVYMCGMIGVAGLLRKHFKDKESFSGTLTFGGKKEVRRQEMIAVFIVLGIMLIAVLAIADVLPIIPMLLPILAAALQLAQAANGVMLSAVAVAIAIFTVIYQYVCTVVEYDEKEL